MEFQPGQELGGYRLVSKIGAGGMGEVWKGEDRKLGRSVAIKILPISLAHDAEARGRLEREARTAAQLYHPNIATIHAMDEAEGRAFIVMEYVEGESLADVLHRGPVSEAEACRIAKAIADALADAHARGIVHRDIKPDNVMLAGNRVKVLDFGIAKQIGYHGASPDAPTNVLTQAGMILGTVQYMSPEQAMGRAVDGRTDIFSLGVLLYQMVTGRLPFTADSVTEVLTKIIRDDAQDVTRVVPSVNPALAAIVRRCMEKDREKRFSSAAELSDALDVILPTARNAVVAPGGTERMEAPPTVQTGPALRRRSGGVIAAVVTLVVLSGAAYVWMQLRAKDPEPVQQKVDVVAPGTSVEVASTTEVPEPVLIENPAVTAPATTTVAAAPLPPLTETIAPAAVTPARATTVEVKKPELDGTKVLAENTYQRGLELLRAGRVRPAVGAFEQTLSADPEHAPARLKLAISEYVTGRKELSLSNFERALQGSVRLTERERQLAAIGVALASGDEARAQELGRSYVAQFGSDAELALLRKGATAKEPRSQRPGPRRRGFRP